MSNLSIFYAIFFLITLMFIGGTYILGYLSLKRNRECREWLGRSINNSLRITGIVAVISIMLINSKVIGENTFTFLCIPFFMIIMQQWSSYFRIIAVYKKTEVK